MSFVRQNGIYIGVCIYVAAFFLVANSSWLPEGSPAVARSPVFPASHNKCHLRFWYYMKGSLSMDYLRVSMLMFGDFSPVPLLLNDKLSVFVVFLNKNRI